MERQNRFDEAMRGKLGALEGEPSARVWAGVQANVGVVRPPQALWPMRVAAGLALLGMVGIGAYLLGNIATNPGQGRSLQGLSKARHIVVQPLDREGRGGTYMAEQAPSAPEQTRQLPTPHAPHKGSMAQQTPTPLQAPLPSPVPLQQDKAPIIAEDQAPRQLPESPILVPEPQEQPKAMAQPAIAEAGTKRSFRLPTRADVQPDALKRKSGAILGAVTNGASSFLGLDANYEEQEQEDQKLIAFNADFGLFKIKRIKSVKQ